MFWFTRPSTFLSWRTVTASESAEPSSTFVIRRSFPADPTEITPLDLEASRLVRKELPVASVATASWPKATLFLASTLLRAPKATPPSTKDWAP